MGVLQWTYLGRDPKCPENFTALETHSALLFPEGAADPRCPLQSDSWPLGLSRCTLVLPSLTRILERAGVTLSRPPPNTHIYPLPITHKQFSPAHLCVQGAGSKQGWHTSWIRTELGVEVGVIFQSYNSSLEWIRSFRNRNWDKNQRLEVLPFKDCPLGGKEERVIK